MREIAVQFMILVVLMLFGCSDIHATDLTLNNALTHVYFSPNGGCTDAIAKEISKAKSDTKRKCVYASIIEEYVL